MLRTPAERFSHLPDFPYEPQFVELEGLRMAYVEAGDGRPILMLHGEPTWGYLYRRMIPALAEVGRVIVPDLIGFGRSDKPVNDNAYSYRSHARWLRRFIEQLDLEQIRRLVPGLGRLARAASSERDARSFLASGSDEYRIARRALDRPGFHAMAAICAASAATRRRRHRAKCLENAHAHRQAAAAYGPPFPRPIIRRVHWLFRAWCRSPDHPELTKIGSPSRGLSSSNFRCCSVGQCRSSAG